jgi:hypothetical protein
MSELRIGVVGYSATDFNERKAKKLVKKGFDSVLDNHSGTPCVVSGLTNIGIPKIAYKEASNRGWKTAGVACNKAEDYETYPVDEKTIVGSDWGDESDEFLSQIDVLIRVGGGDQAIEETEHASSKGIEVYEYDLPPK